MDKNILNNVYRQLELSQEESKAVFGGSECHCIEKQCTILCQSSCTLIKDCVSGGTLSSSISTGGNTGKL